MFILCNQKNFWRVNFTSCSVVKFAWLHWLNYKLRLKLVSNWRFSQRKVTRLKKFLTRHFSKNKIFHGTRFAQTPGKFYFLSATTAKFLMPRLHLTRTFLLLNLVCFAFYRTLQLLIIKRYATNNFVQLKLTATLLLLIKIYQSANLNKTRLSKNRRKL